MAVSLSILKEKIQTAFPLATVEIIDLVGDGDHLQATIIAPEFEGKKLLEQHKMVYACLGDMMKASLHALALKTYAPSQYKK